MPGASAGRVGLVLRIHHAIADGMAAVAIAHRLFEGDELGCRGPTPPTHPPVRSPSSRPTARVERRGGADPRRVLGKLGFGLQRVLTTLVGRGIGPTILLGERSPRHGVAFVDADLAALEARVRALGATVNDALLAAVGRRVRGGAVGRG